MPPLDNTHWNFPKIPKLRLHTPPRGADPQVCRLGSQAETSSPDPAPLSPSQWTRNLLNFHPDPIQTQLLDAQDPLILLNCSRQWGKTTVIAAKALHFAFFHPRTTTLVAAPSERQSLILLRRLRAFLQTLAIKPAPIPDVPLSLRLPNGSEIIALPASADTIRGFTAHLLIFDEAARVPDALYHALSPSRATTGGPLWLLSTPNGPTGFFYEAWHEANPTPIRRADPLVRAGSPDPALAEVRERSELAPLPQGPPPEDPQDAEVAEPGEPGLPRWDAKVDENTPPDPHPLHLQPRTERAGHTDDPNPLPLQPRTERAGRPDDPNPLPLQPRTERAGHPDDPNPLHQPRAERAGLRDDQRQSGSPGRFSKEHVSDNPAPLSAPHWARFLVPATECPRIAPAFLDHERLILGDIMFRQEYLCEFTAGPHTFLSLELLASAIDPSIEPLFTEPLFSGPNWNRP